MVHNYIRKGISLTSFSDSKLKELSSSSGLSESEVVRRLVEGVPLVHSQSAEKQIESVVSLNPDGWWSFDGKNVHFDPPLSLPLDEVVKASRIIFDSLDKVKNNFPKGVFTAKVHILMEVSRRYGLEWKNVYYMIRE